MLLALSRAARGGAALGGPPRARRRRLGAEHVGHGARGHPERLRVGDPARRSSTAPRAARPRPTSRERACRAASRRAAARRARAARARARAGARARAARSTMRTIASWRERLGPGELQALVALGRLAVQRGGDAGRRRRRPRSAGTARARGRARQSRAAARARSMQRQPGVAGRVDERAGAPIVDAIPAEPTASSASALARRKRVRSCAVAPSALRNTKRSHAGALGRLDHAPGRDPVQLLDRPGRLVADRRGEVHDGATRRASRCGTTAGRLRSPSAICTRTRSAPSRRGSRTRQRTGVPPATRRGSSAEPTSPVAPVSRSIAARSVSRSERTSR